MESPAKKQKSDVSSTSCRPVNESLSSLQTHLLWILKSSPVTLSPWKLLTNQDENLREYYNGLEDLNNKRFVEYKDGKVLLTDKGHKAIDCTGEHKESKVNALTEPWQGVACEHCETRGYVVPKSSSGLLKKYKEMLQTRPEPSEDFDQTSITAEDAFIRVGFFLERGDLVGKELLMIGDFDCLSLIAALSGLIKRAVVLEGDTRLVDYLNTMAKQHSLPLQAIKFDVREGLPKGISGNFDVFSCDPVETLEGIKLFLSRGTEGLREKGVLYFGLTTLEASKKKWQDIQRILLNMNYVVTDCRRNFNGYPDTGLEVSHEFHRKMAHVAKPDCIWYWASLLRAQLVGEATDIPFLGPYVGDSNIYLDNEAWATPTKAN